MLAIHAGTPFGADALIDELWAGEPPEGAATTLRSYVSRLRAALGDGVPIEHSSAGYVLEVSRERVDVARFEALIRDGRQLLEQGRHRRAAGAFRDALALWRGKPFAGLAEDGALRAEAARLEELRLLAFESRVEADLELGRDAELIEELETVLAEHPFRERLWQHLMLALYRAGRQADALGAYHRARAALDEQLGVEPGEALRTLEAEILRQEVPEAQARRAPAVGLPVSLTSFVGRSQELGEVRALLGRARLVTLVGVGGVGKTRLAIEAARGALEDLADGVAFVDLAPLSDPALLATQVAGSLGLRDTTARDLAVALAERVGTREVLLVLDNCEHVREAAASLAQDLLAGSPDLRILATSRAVLDVAGEATYPVPPLGLSASTGESGGEPASEAVRLLLDRAVLTRHDLRLDDAAYHTAARICRELDGLPLAIELAAARTKALSLDEIAERLRDRFQFLVSWRRLTAARHRTLREAMDWSYELLAPAEQRLLVRLSVFPAGATLASIAAVCLDGETQEDHAEQLVERLVDASLLVPSDGSRGTRYRLLETVRQYGAEQLPEADLDDLRRRHAERALAIAESTNLYLEATGPSTGYELAREELPTTRAAIAWAEDAEPTLAAEIACALERFWVTSHAREGIATFTGLLARDEISDGLRARVLRCRGGCRYTTGDFDGGVEDYEQALAIHRRLGDAAHEAHLVMRLAIEANRRGDRALAQQLLDEAASIGGERRFTPDEYVGLGLASDLAFEEGRAGDAVQMLHTAAALARQAQDRMWLCDSLMRLTHHALDQGRLDDAGRAGREALVLAHEMGDRQWTIYILALLARHAGAAGFGHRAGRIWGGLEAEAERREPLGQWELERGEMGAQVAAAVGDAGDVFEAGVEEGRSLSLDSVVAEALSPG